MLVMLQPKVVTATDEAELARQMERAEAENAEVAGDSAEEDEDQGMYLFSVHTLSLCLQPRVRLKCTRISPLLFKAHVMGAS